MELTEYLERDRQRFTDRLQAASSPEEAVMAAQSEVDRILYQYNEDCGDNELRERAASLLQTVRMALSFIDTGGEVRIWESRTGQGRLPGKVKRDPLKILCLAAGTGLWGAAAVREILFMNGTAGWITFGIALAGSALLMAGGYLTGKKAKTAGTSEQMVSQLPDPQKIYRGLHSTLMIADRNLAGLTRTRKERLLPGQDEYNGEQLSDTQLSLLSDLLEASYSRDGVFALARLSDVAYFLHRCGIETEDYSPGHDQWFDALPAQPQMNGSAGGQTLRPALVSKDGKLLKKGLVSRSFEEN